MPRNLNYFGFARIGCSTRIAVLRKLEASAVGGREHVCMVLEEGQTQLRFLHVDQRECSLHLINPQMHLARLEAVFKNRAIMQEGVQACGFSAPEDAV